MGGYEMTFKATLCWVLILSGCSTVTRSMSVGSLNGVGDPSLVILTLSSDLSTVTGRDGNRDAPHRVVPIVPAVHRGAAHEPRGAGLRGEEAFDRVRARRLSRSVRSTLCGSRGSQAHV